MLIQYIKHFIRKNRTSYLIKIFANLCEKYLSTYYNENYFNMTKNGESMILERYARLAGNSHPIILDVGSNRGDWAKETIKYLSASRIYCFEIIPGVRTLLSESLGRYPNIEIVDYGLSDHNGDVVVQWNATNDETSAICPRNPDSLDDEWANMSMYKPINCKVQTGDQAMSMLKLGRIDIIKIDVEGHEVEVLKGFENLLSSPTKKPKLIQLEYGTTYLPPKHTLSEVYELLEKNGYVIGRLYTNGVDFKSYNVKDDNFRMGNYIAINENESELINILKE